MRAVTPRLRARCSVTSIAATLSSRLLPAESGTLVGSPALATERERPARCDASPLGREQQRGVGSTDGCSAEPGRQGAAMAHVLIAAVLRLSKRDSAAGLVTASPDRAPALSPSATTCRCWPRRLLQRPADAAVLRRRRRCWRSSNATTRTPVSRVVAIHGKASARAVGGWCLLLGERRGLPALACRVSYVWFFVGADASGSRIALPVQSRVGKRSQATWWSPAAPPVVAGSNSTSTTITFSWSTRLSQPRNEDFERISTRGPAGRRRRETRDWRRRVRWAGPRARALHGPSPRSSRRGTQSHLITGRRSKNVGEIPGRLELRSAAISGTLPE